MARYIPLDVVVAEINKRIMDAPINHIGHQRVWAYNDVKDILNTLETKEVQEEPVIKGLEEAAIEAFKHIVDSDKNSFLEIFKAGAKWKEEQYKKNLLDVCKKQTEEEAEIERDFIEGIIDEHRLPTFDDAIKYGMRLQKEQMMKDAFDAELDDVCGFLTISVPYHNGIAGDKVKVIIIKSE